MLRLELIFLHSANGGGCFRWRDSGQHSLGQNLCSSRGLNKNSSSRLPAGLEERQWT
jgi:hypothetical protein